MRTFLLNPTLLWSIFFKVCISIFVCIFIYFVTHFFIKGLKKANNRVQKIDPTLLPITLTVIKYAAFILAIFIILNIFGANTNGIIALLGAAGLGLALALKDTLQNIASGIMLIFLRPFNKNDYIENSSVAGTVQEINLFTTTLKTADGLYLFVPNGILWNSPIKNYSRNSTRRLDIVVGIAYKNKIELAISVLNEIVKNEARVLNDPAPIIEVTALADNSVNILIRVWTNIDDYWNLNFYLQRIVKEHLEQAGLSIPFPQRDIYLHLSQTSPSTQGNMLKALKETNS